MSSERGHAVPEPSAIDLTRELREALGMFAGAMPVSPKAAWEEALADVRRVVTHRQQVMDALAILALHTPIEVPERLTGRDSQ